MADTTYELNFDVSNGTSMISNLLNAEDLLFISDLDPDDLEYVFGPGDTSCFIQSKGYTDPEWYWQSSDGCVWGIGWRWGETRLRGRGGGRMENRRHPSPESAAAFVAFLREAIHRSIV